MALAQEEIFEKVQEALVDALGVDDDEVSREATLVGDLGAESIDFLDIVFKLEKAFEITIPREELSPEDISRFSDGELRKRLVAHFRSVGYEAVTLDLEGYRTGRLNELHNGKIAAGKPLPQDS